MARLLVILCLLLVAAAASGDTYEWVDEQGVLHFTDNPASIPIKGTVKRRESLSETMPPAAIGTPQAEAVPLPATLPPPATPSELFGGHPGPWWLEQFQELRRELTKLKDELPGKKQQMRQDHARFLGKLEGMNVPGTTQQLRKNYRGLTAEIGRDEARIRQLEQELVTLESAADKASVPGRWRQ